MTSANVSGGYSVKCGTSMASPAVTGIAALLVQQFRQSFPGGTDLDNATIKAILANTAVDVEATGPDFKTGFGSVRGIPAVDTVAQRRFARGQVAQSDVKGFVIVVTAGDPVLQVTVAWDDPPGTPNVLPVLVNDLDLRIIGPGGVAHYPWTLDPADPGAVAVRTKRDALNNIEQVRVDAPAAGTYRVEIEGYSIADGPTQLFGLASTHSLERCTSAGTLGVTPRQVSCEGLLRVELTDCDLNIEPLVFESTNVTVTSPLDSESLALDEEFAGDFSGVLALSAGAVPSALQVADGQTVTVNYLDADDGDGGIDVAVSSVVLVDCAAPGITGVAVTEVERHEATVAISLDQDAEVLVRYGTACPPSDGVAIGAGASAMHAVPIRNLTGATTYFLSVTATDLAGNGSADDNGGSCYSFTTPAMPQSFTEWFQVPGLGFPFPFDPLGNSLTFTPDRSEDYYTTCSDPLDGSLPVDLELGTAVVPGIDESTEVFLSGGRTVSLFGNNYSSLWIARNGHVTFGQGDNSRQPCSFGSCGIRSPDIHFSIPRIAPFYRSFTTNGEARWHQLADRVVVTWDSMEDRFGLDDDISTFQLELFFDGVIRMSWLETTGVPFLVGLSRGDGVDPDFAVTDLMPTATCPSDSPLQFGVDEREVYVMTLAGNDAPQPLSFSPPLHADLDVAFQQTASDTCIDTLFGLFPLIAQGSANQTSSLRPGLISASALANGEIVFAGACGVTSADTWSNFHIEFATDIAYRFDLAGDLTNAEISLWRGASGRLFLADTDGAHAYGNVLPPDVYDLYGYARSSPGIFDGASLFDLTLTIADANEGAGRVTDLQAGRTPGGDLQLDWDASCSDDDDDYAIYEGSLGDYAGHTMLVCSTGGLTTTTVTPSAGDRYYLVVPLDAAFEGSYGRDSFGAERGTALATCQPHQRLAAVCDLDSDGDGIPDLSDNCPADANPDQADLDGNGVGDACDSDDENDGVSDGLDNCPRTPNPGQQDDNGDGVGNACEPDIDYDGVWDYLDNCPETPNPGQADTDFDGTGDACENLGADPKLVFIGGSNDGNVGGLAGADQECVNAAASAQLTGTFKAWLSGTTLDGGMFLHARDRMTGAGGPFVNVIGQPIATSWADFLDGWPVGTELQRQDGGKFEDLFWTGTTSDGRNVRWDGTPTLFQNCDNWTSDSARDNSTAGRVPVESENSWSDYTVQGCPSILRFLCVEQ